MKLNKLNLKACTTWCKQMKEAQRLRLHVCVRVCVVVVVSVVAGRCLFVLVCPGFFFRGNKRGRGGGKRKRRDDTIIEVSKTILPSSETLVDVENY